MGLISTLKELLGMETRERPQRHDVEVTVEREPDAGSERAVKEPVASATASAETEAESATGGDAAEEAATSETATGQAETDEAATEEAETDEEVTEDAETDEEFTEEGVSDPDTETETERSAEDTASDQSTQSIKGIGSAYAERLATAGIETVGDLADADPDTVAADADVPQARLEDWIERAKEKR